MRASGGCSYHAPAKPRAAGPLVEALTVVDRRWILTSSVVLAALGVVLSWIHPAHPLWPTGAASLLLVATIGAGVAWIRSGIFGPVAVRGAPGRGRVALTFDDGPDPHHTLRVAHILERAGQRGTFFVIGERVEAHAGVLRQLVERGHEVGVHSMGHRVAAVWFHRGRIRNDLETCSRLVEDATGRRPRFYRPPVGLLNPRVVQVAAEDGWTVVGWSARGRDGVPACPAAVVRRVERALEDGDIVLLHDRLAEGTPAAVEALPAILDGLSARGLRAVVLSELLGRPAYGARDPHETGSG